MRDGREARPFFDPKRSARRQFFGRNRSHPAPWNSDRRARTPPLPLDHDFAEKTEGDTLGTIAGSGAAPASPRRRCIAPGCRDVAPNDLY